MAGDEPKDDPDAWIEKVVKVAAVVGFNPTRTRWKLIRWHNNRQRAHRRSQQVVEHIRYQHKTCPRCGHVQDRDETTCSRCEASLGRRGSQVLARLGLRMPEISLSVALAIAILAVYVREVAALGGGLGAPSPELLFQLGGHWAPSVPDQPWRLVTAMFLHIGLWHVGFNLLSMAMIGPRIEELYGRATMPLLFLATGVLANLGSGAVGLGAVSAGASGGIMGLIGVAGGYGHRSGTPIGRALRDDMVKWMLYTLLFGYFVRADNWAHVFGGLSGAAFGLAVKPQWWMSRNRRPLRIVAGVLAVIVTIGALAIIFSRTVTPILGT